jgi:hypothetical protein
MREEWVCVGRGDGQFQTGVLAELEVGLRTLDVILRFDIVVGDCGTVMLRAGLEDLDS